jgi:hypothetical protein
VLNVAMESQTVITLSQLVSRKIQMIQMLRDEALKAFEMWDKKVDKVKY